MKASCIISHQNSAEAQLFNEINSTRSIPEIINILNNYHNKDNQLTTEHAAFFIESNSDSPEVIKCFIQHDVCTKIHLIHFVKTFYANAQFVCYCLDNEKFTTDFEEYRKYAGESFYTTCENYMKNNNFNDLYCLMNRVLQKEKNLFSSLNLINLSIWMSDIYDQVKKDDACPVERSESLKAMLEDVIFQIINHPEYQFYIPNHVLELREEAMIDYNGDNPFYFAAANAFENTILRFYDHPDTSDVARKNAITILHKNGHDKLINNMASHLYQTDYEERCIAFLISMGNLKNSLVLLREINIFIINLLKKAMHMEYFHSFIKSGEPPEIYKKNKLVSPTLFQPANASYGRIISIALGEIRNYCDNSPSKTGLNRSYAFIEIFLNETLSLKFKMMALYALIEEKTFCENRSKNYVLSGIDCYRPIIEAAAREFASGLDQDLNFLKDNLIRLIHNTDSHTTRFFDISNEETLVKQICITYKIWYGVI